MSFEVPFVAGPPAHLQNKYINEVTTASRAFWERSLTLKCSDWFAQHYGQTVTFLDSCTSALKVCALLLKLQPGDEVIFPSFTHVSTVLPFVEAGAKPVFVEVSPGNFCMDTAYASEAIGPQTRAIVAVNYGGWAPDYAQLRGLCERYGLKLIEDNAHGIGSKVGDQLLGTFGNWAAFSFERQKNITCHEGGALLINDDTSGSYLEQLVNLGTNRAIHERGQAAYYEWLGPGMKSSFTEWQAACLLPQFESLDILQSDRRKAWDRYYDRLSTLNKLNLIEIPPKLSPGENAHLFYLILRDPEERNALFTFLNQEGVEAPFHYFPLHLSAYGRKTGRFVGPETNTLKAGLRLLRLPLFPGITDAQQDFVISLINRFYSDR